MSRLETRMSRLEGDAFGADDPTRFVHVPSGEEESERALQMFHDFAKRGIELWIRPIDWAPSQPLWVPVTLDDLTDDELQTAINQLDRLITQHNAIGETSDGSQA